MTEQNNLEYCKKCQKEVDTNYCSNCGYPRELKRIDKKYIVAEIGSVLNFDKGIFYTIKELLIRPGITVKKFIREDRNRLVKPVIFIIVSSLVYSLLREILHFEDAYIYYDDLKQSASVTIFAWIQNNYGYGNLIMGIFIALWTKLLFRKYGYNFYEIIILLCFVMGMGMLILSVFGTIEGLTKLKVLDYGGMAFIIYSSWAVGQFFDKKKFKSYLKALLSYFFGMLTFALVILLIGSLIDFLT